MKTPAQRLNLGCSSPTCASAGAISGYQASIVRSASPQDMETDEQPLLTRFGYRPDDLPLEIRGGYRGVGERWKPDDSWLQLESMWWNRCANVVAWPACLQCEAGKLLRMAYAFLWPHGRQVADLEVALYKAARAAEPENGLKAGQQASKGFSVPESLFSGRWLRLQKISPGRRKLRWVEISLKMGSACELLHSTTPYPTEVMAVVMLFAQTASICTGRLRPDG